jgi:Fic family protein
MNNRLANLPLFPAFTWSLDVLNPILADLRLKQGQLVEKMEALKPEFKEMAHAEMLNFDAIGILKIVAPELNIDNQLAIQPLILAVTEARWPMIGQTQNTITLAQIEQTYFQISTLIGNQVFDNQLFSSQFNVKQLEQFLTWFNKPGLDRLLKAGITHLWFTAISPNHPASAFIAGILSDIQLGKADKTTLRYYSIGHQISKQLVEYQFIISQSLQGSLDITIWLQWYLSCLGKAYDRASTQLAPILARAHYWNSHSNPNLNPRQQAIINILLAGFHEKLTTTIYANLTHCSRDTALRDVTNLLSQNVFIKKAGKGKNTEYLLNFPLKN